MYTLHRLVPVSHLPVTQSESAAQTPPMPQRASQVVPPRSMPVSVSSFTRLTQEMRVSASQCPLAQSVTTRHSFVSSQKEH